MPLDGPAAPCGLLVLLTIFGTVDFGLSSGLVALAVSFERGRPSCPSGASTSPIVDQLLRRRVRRDAVVLLARSSSWTF